MASVSLAQITCPNCRNPFQAYVEQILDAREDPSVKIRLLNGLVNVIDCPHCKMRGALDIPFLYHDPENELALVYLPMNAGRTEMERQQVIGQFTSAVMNSLPPEERKAYLLQPQVNFTLEGIRNKILETDGVTPEMIEQQRSRAELLQRMLDASSEDAQDVLIQEQQAAIDAELIRMLAMNLELVQSAGEEIANLQPLLLLYNKLLTQTEAGRTIKARSDAIEALRAEPSREKLLSLLMDASDDHTRELLITFGRPLLDYRFFQILTAAIEAEAEPIEKERLTHLRSEVLNVRDQIDEATRALFAERSKLLRDLLMSEEPDLLAQRRFREFDDVFFNVLTANLEEAQSAGDQQAVRALQQIWNLVLEMVEESLPPELRFFNRLMEAENEAEVDHLLHENQHLVTEQLITFLEETNARMQEEGSEEAAEHLARILRKARAVRVGVGVE
jgi:hypothetical protein